MRNEPKPLDHLDAQRQRLNLSILERAMAEGRVVTLEYVKRNGNLSSATGPVQFFNGKPGFDTGSVTVDSTESKGRPTTVNLHRITVIK